MQQPRQPKIKLVPVDTWNAMDWAIFLATAIVVAFELALFVRWAPRLTLWWIAGYAWVLAQAPWIIAWRRHQAFDARKEQADE